MIKNLIIFFFFFFFKFSFAKSEYIEAGIDLFNKKNLMMQDLNSARYSF